MLSKFSNILKKNTAASGALNKVEERLNLSRMEAFLSATPFEYCGWSGDGYVAFSKGFCRLFNLDDLRRVQDIADQIESDDAKALDSYYIDLRRSGRAFELDVKCKNISRVIRLHGQRGFDVSGDTLYDILWAVDVTDTAQKHKAMQLELDSLAKESGLFEHVLNATHIPYWTFDRDGAIDWCNSAMLDAFGSQEDQKQQSLPDAEKLTFTPLHADHKKHTQKQSFLSMHKNALDHQEKSYHMAARIIMTGARKDVDITLQGFDKEDGVKSAGFGFIEDITEQQNLKSEIERYQTASTKLLQNFNTAIAIFTADQKIEFYNSAFALLWGLEDRWLNTAPKLNEIMEKLREERRLPEQADFKSFKNSWIEKFTSLLAPHEDMLHLPDGRALRVMFAPHPLGGLMITFEDVTSRLELESSYNTLIAVQKETLDNLGEGVAVYGSDGRLKLWNPSFLAIWALEPEHLDAEPHVSVVVDKKKKFFDSEKGQKRQRFSKKNPWEKMRERLIRHALERDNIKETILRDDGTHIEVNQISLPDGGVMLTYRNVTDTVMVERALREKASALEEAEKLKMDFLANVSYQLRTPLNAIMGFSEILSNEYFGSLNDKQKEYSDGIAEAGQRLMSLIDNILDLSTIEAGYLTLDKTCVDLSQTLKDIFDLSREWAGQQSLQAHLTVPEDLGDVHADERRIKQVLLNLVRNAITFTPAGGDIYIEGKLSEDEQSAYISVRDTGIGISQEDQDKIFEPFVRADQDVNAIKQSGPGLGLSLVKNIVDLHDGRVLLDSEEGRGTTITVVLPLIKKQS
jgi:signal transduction histidine kinase